MPSKTPRMRESALLRLALVADLFIYVIGVALFAYLPLFKTVDGSPNTTDAFETAFTFAALPVIAGLAGRLFTRPHLPGNQWSYLVTAFYGIIVLLAFNGVSGDSLIAPWEATLVIDVWLLSGIVGALFGHVMDGGNGPSVQERVERMRHADTRGE